LKIFTGCGLLPFDILNILSITGEQLFGRYLPVNEEGGGGRYRIIRVKDKSVLASSIIINIIIITFT
jgi:hypothetical protein